MKKLRDTKILYIDDETFIRQNAVEYLNFYTDHVYEAKDGQDGLDVYAKVKPDIIITDINMPKLNGLEMVKAIRKRDKTTKVIIATAFLETKYLLEAVELGLVKYLVKPITEDKILPVLRSCLEDFPQEGSIFYLEEGFIYDKLNHTLFKEQKGIDLTKKEMLFFDLLCSNCKRAVKYEEFNAAVWQGEMSEDALRSVVKELRKKTSKNTIKNISGIGYQVQLMEQR
jgi:DNA-binding response OmpR family regulator